MRPRSPEVLLIEDSVAPSVGSFLESQRNFGGPGQIDTRHLVKCGPLELDQTEDGALPVPGEPNIDRTVIVRFPASLSGQPGQVGLRQSPTAVLAALDRDFQDCIATRDHQVILRLIGSILY